MPYANQNYVRGIDGTDRAVDDEAATVDWMH
jgi:hypothetical protein